MNIVFDDVPLTMEVDTGAGCSLISKETYIKLWPYEEKRPKLKISNTNLNVYDGSRLSVAGEIGVRVALPDVNYSVLGTVVIVDKPGPTLLGRDLLSKLKIDSVSIPMYQIRDDYSNLSSKFPELFSEGLGCLKDMEVEIEVNPEVCPKFCRARSVPYVMKEKFVKELDRLVSEGIISPVSHSKWAAAVVPVMKSNVSVRICGDYKLTVNRAAKVDTYPIPRVEDFFSGLSGGRYFSVLDLSQAYSQLCLKESSRKYTVINTQRGLFQYNRLCFDISTALGLFQRTMESLLAKVPNCVVFLDDILVVGSTKAEHDSNLDRVLFVLEDAGLKLQFSKCKFGTCGVKYLEFKLNA